jgi:hypothetical protein
MKHLRSFGACMCGLLLLACAGTTPTTTSGGTGGGVAIATTPKVEMIYSPGLGTTTTLPVFGDPLNIRTGEQVRFQMVGYTSTGERVVLPANNWRTSDTSNTFGTLSNTGVYDAASRQTPSTYLVSGTYNGVEYSTEYSIKGRETRVTGSVLNQGTGLPVSGVYLYFYDVNGDYVGIAQSTYDGSFRAALPRTAQRFQVVNDSLSATFHRLIQFNSTAALSTVRPSYLDNRNSSGVVVAQSVSTSGTQYRLTGVSQQCKPLLSSTTSLPQSDYYLSNPILVVPTTATNGLGALIDPLLVAEGCTVP